MSTLWMSVDEFSLLQISHILSPIWKQLFVTHSVSRIHRRNLVCLGAVLNSNNIYIVVVPTH